MGACCVKEIQEDLEEAKADRANLHAAIQKLTVAVEAQHEQQQERYLDQQREGDVHVNNHTPNEEELREVAAQQHGIDVADPRRNMYQLGAGGGAAVGSDSRKSNADRSRGRRGGPPDPAETTAPPLVDLDVLNWNNIVNQGSNNHNENYTNHDNATHNKSGRRRKSTSAASYSSTPSSYSSSRLTTAAPTSLAGGGVLLPPPPIPPPVVVKAQFPHQYYTNSSSGNSRSRSLLINNNGLDTTTPGLHFKNKKDPARHPAPAACYDSANVYDGRAVAEYDYNRAVAPLPRGELKLTLSEMREAELL